MTNNPQQAVFIDRNQAGHSIDHHAVMIAPEIIGLSERALRIVRFFYIRATFFTTNPLGTYARGEVGSGIRQECPFSPYLRIMILSFVFEHFVRGQAYA